MKIVNWFACIVALCIAVAGAVVAAPQGESAAVTANVETRDYFSDKVSVDYSDVFNVEYHPNYKIVTVAEPWPGADSGFTYVLVQRGTAVPTVPEADKVIEIPIRSVVTMSTSYLPHLEMLGVLDTLIGHDAFAWVSSAAALERINSGDVTEVGSGPSVNVELLLDMEPDLIMTYGQGGEWDAHPKLEEARLPYVISAEWNEKTPLARAEWIKFMAVFYNKEKEAAEAFDEIVSAYQALKTKAAGVEDRPTVFSGAPYQGTWWVSGGASYAARFLADAGAEYIWENDESTGSLMLDIETVYEQAGEADYWINTSYWGSLADAKAADERFTKFNAYETGNVYNNNLRMSPGGGNEYFETGPARPDWVLADLIKIFHPALLPDHELHYYRKLK